jgi:hypothetical protein
MSKYAKTIVAVVTAALVALVGALPMGSSATQWVNFALAVVGAIAVYLVPNAAAKRPVVPQPQPPVPPTRM